LITRLIKAQGLERSWTQAFDRLKERAAKSRLPLVFTAAAVASFGLLPGTSRDLAALPAADPVLVTKTVTKAAASRVDAELVELSAADAPAEVFMGTGKLVSIKSVVSRHGRSKTTDLRVLFESEGSDGAIISPPTATLIESGLASSEKRDLEAAFSVDCTRAGTHTFNISARVEPLQSVEIDPDLSNNQRRLSFQVTCLPCLHASESVDLGAGTEVTVAQALSGNYFELGTGGASIAGNVVADGNVFLRSTAAVHGNLTFAGRLYQQGDFSVAGAIVNGTVDFVSIPRQTVAPGASDLVLGPDSSAIWQPGAYATGSVGPRSTVRLSPGTYRFRTLQVDSDARITANTAAGDVRIQVEQSMGLGDRSSLGKTGAGSISIYSNASGLVRIGADARFEASLRAPQGYVQVASGTAIKGCMSARAISYAPRVRQHQF
jgi:hypothetical protein